MNQLLQADLLRKNLIFNLPDSVMRQILCEMHDSVGIAKVCKYQVRAKRIFFVCVTHRLQVLFEKYLNFILWKHLSILCKALQTLFQFNLCYIKFGIRVWFFERRFTATVSMNRFLKKRTFSFFISMVYFQIYTVPQNAHDVMLLENVRSNHSGPLNLSIPRRG